MHNSGVGDVRVVLAPHIDDEVLGMGGTIAYLSNIGIKVIVVYLTDSGGIYSGSEREHYVKARRHEAMKVADILGVYDAVFLNFPDSKLHEYIDSAAEEIVRVVKYYGASTMYVPHPREYHPDHRAANQVARLAVWRLAYLHGYALHHIYEYEVWPPMHSFTDVIDVTKYIEKKRLAIEVFAKGTQKYLDPEAILALNKYRGFWTLGRGYVEVFNVISLWKIKTEPS